MKRTVHEIAAHVGGVVHGDANALIERVRGIDEAGEGDLTFVANRKYRSRLKTTGATAVLIAPGTEEPGRTLIVVADPYVAFGEALALFHPREPERPGIHERAFVDGNARVSPEASIHPGAAVSRGAEIGGGAVLYPGVYVGPEAVIGEGSVLYPNVTVYDRCLIGRRVILHAGVVVGSDGFGFARPGWENIKIPQVGIVQIDDDVEIGANTTIDRGTLGRTWIQKGAKIDNLVQIAHNVVIGENAIVVSQAGISGSTTVGRGVMIGGQAGLVGHIRVGDHAMVAARAGIHKDVPAATIVAGAPHMPHREWLRLEATIPKLPAMRKQLIELARKLEVLEKKLEGRNS
ncbi:MAG: UDP-3-O-(3-hydroxymyristoyl)glucosamine N-acyltransferase [Syntrophaceae bacterium]|nr:UDP-3-O-(3-hydroxymyristoyl)glucosamine N-acyltransferase [Syntrophaceae bacterium]